MDVKKTISAYDRKLAQDAKIAKLERQAKEGSRKWQAAEELASRTGMTAALVLLTDLLEEYPDGKIPEEAARELTVPLLKHNHDIVSSVAEGVQQTVNEEAEVGLKPVVPEFNKGRAEGLAKNIASWDDLSKHKEQVQKEVENNSRSIVDVTIRENAKAHAAVGLEPRVTRIYDGVGLSNGRTCEWCKERCGEDMSYREAYAKGAFQRHPGCGCEILYTVGKRTQRQTDWTRNQWEDISVKKEQTITVQEEENRYEGYPDSWLPLNNNAQLVDVNPEGYTDNCVSCCLAYEIRCKEDARDVVARAGDNVLIHNPFAGWIDSEIISIESSGSVKYIETLMGLWGDDARAQISFLWKNSKEGLGHSLMAHQRKGTTFFLDVQHGLQYNETEIINLLEEQASKIELCRTDTLEISEVGINACRGR